MTSFIYLCFSSLLRLGLCFVSALLQITFRWGNTPFHPLHTFWDFTGLRMERGNPGRDLRASSWKWHLSLQFLFHRSKKATWPHLYSGEPSTPKKRLGNSTNEFHNLCREGELVRFLWAPYVYSASISQPFPDCFLFSVTALFSSLLTSQSKPPHSVLCLLPSLPHLEFSPVSLSLPPKYPGGCSWEMLLYTIVLWSCIMIMTLASLELLCLLVSGTFLMIKNKPVTSGWGRLWWQCVIAWIMNWLLQPSPGNDIVIVPWLVETTMATPGFSMSRVHLHQHLLLTQLQPPGAHLVLGTPRCTLFSGISQGRVAPSRTSSLSKKRWLSLSFPSLFPLSLLSFISSFFCWLSSFLLFSISFFLPFFFLSLLPSSLSFLLACFFSFSFYFSLSLQLQSLNIRFHILASVLSTEMNKSVHIYFQYKGVFLCALGIDDKKWNHWVI